MNRKNNRRVQRTKAVFEKTLLELIQQRSMEQITVVDLCRASHLNRSTFYAHYKSPYDVLYAIRNRLIEESPRHEEAKSLAPKERLEDYLHYIHLNGEAFHLMYHFDLSFQTALVEKAVLIFLQDNRFLGSEKDMECLKGQYHLHYAAAGAAYSIDRWIVGGYAIEESEFADWILEYLIS